MGKNILIISEFIAPVQHIAAIRWTKYAKYLVKDCGCSVTVLTNQKDFKGSKGYLKTYLYDSSLERDSKWFETVYIPLSMRQRFFNRIYSFGYRLLHRMQKKRCDDMVAADGLEKNKAPTRSSISKLFFGFLVSKNIPERVYELVDRFCGNALVASGARSVIDFSHFDAVISSYGPRWPHDLALRLKRSYPQLFWVADFRDPIVYSEKSNTRAKRKLTRRFVDRADMVIGVSKGCLDNLYVDWQKNHGVIYNGYDPDDVSGRSRKSAERFNLVYTGTLYSDGDAKRDLAPLYRAVSELIDEGVLDCEQLVCTYAGSSSHLFDDYIRHFPCVPFDDKGLLSREEALSLQSEGSALIVSNWNTPVLKGGLSGKVFEYLSKDVPLIGLVSGSVPHSALRELIESCEAGVCYEEADASSYERMKNFIAELYCDWNRSGVTTRGEHSMRLSSKYAYPKLAGALYDAMERRRRVECYRTCGKL